MKNQFNNQLQMKEICDNYEMGFITESEFKFQFINSISGKTFQNFMQYIIDIVPIEQYFDFASKLKTIED
jgi:hypothetical protein